MPEIYDIRKFIHAGPMVPTGYYIYEIVCLDKQSNSEYIVISLFLYFFIAFATSLCHCIDPTTVTFAESKLCSHL